MSAWPGKSVIGLTGNIATGKSLVRLMLEDLGAFGIDADQAAHKVIAPGTPGYEAVVSSFGEGILDADGSIDRVLLGNIVFPDPSALQNLEEIIHPHVGEEINHIINSTPRDVFVIEAIKLIEAKLNDLCDVLWVTCSPKELQIDRLMKYRHMSRQEAIQRINAQPPQEEKIALADVTIHNSGTTSSIWNQVVEAWRKFFPGTYDQYPAMPEKYIFGQK